MTRPFITQHHRPGCVSHRSSKWLCLHCLHGPVHDRVVLLPEPGLSLTTHQRCHNLVGHPVSFFSGTTSGQLFYGLSVGQSSDAQFLQKSCSGTGNQAPATHFHWIHLYVPALLLHFSCQAGELQPLPFECLINGVLPRDSRFNDKETLVGFGPEDQV